MTQREDPTVVADGILAQGHDFARQVLINLATHLEALRAGVMSLRSACEDKGQDTLAAQCDLLLRLKAPFPLHPPQAGATETTTGDPPCPETPLQP